MYMGSWCTGSNPGREDAVEETLVRVLKNWVNLRVGTAVLGVDTLKAESGGRVEVGVDVGVFALFGSFSAVVHSLKPQREAVLGCFACDGVEGPACAGAVVILEGTPTLLSEMKVRKARTQSSDAS